MMETNAAMLRSKEIRKTMYKNEWWFSVVDVCAALADCADANTYCRNLKQRLEQESNEVVTFCHGLKLPAPDGKLCETDCANTEGVFRIIQAISSPKAESYKRWLAKVGYEHMQEIEDPELISRRMRAIYRSKGLECEKHCDPRTDLELIFSMLGEAATAEIARKQDTRGLSENKGAARKGKRIAGDAQKQLEAETGSKVSTPEYYFDEPESRKRLKRQKGINELS